MKKKQQLTVNQNQSESEIAYAVRERSLRSNRTQAIRKLSGEAEESG